MTAAPLCILVITSRPMIDPEGNPLHLLDVEKERRRIAEGFRKSGIAARARFLAEATTSASQDALRDEWDVVHYTGHGPRTDASFWKTEPASLICSREKKRPNSSRPDPSRSSYFRPAIRKPRAALL
jgi:hypothetical protein